MTSPSTPPRSSRAVHAGSLARLATGSRLLDAQVSFSRQPFVRPLILSTGAIEAITQADAVVRVQVNGKAVEGRGCIYLSDLWAWPDPAFTHEQRDAAMRDYCRHLAAAWPRRCSEPGHPLSLGLDLHAWVSQADAGPSSATAGDAVTPPPLARSVCASVFDAAVHDAVGRGLGVSAFGLYDADLPLAEADEAFGGVGQTFAAVADMLLPTPRTTSPAWWIVGKADDLQADLKPAVQKYGLFAFKLKIMGRDPQEDAQRVADVFHAARQWGIDRPRLTIDSNEANPDARSVMQFLDILADIAPQAYDALEMIEQPTGRDIARHAFDWTPVARRKPVMVDEGLTSLEAMSLAREQGWSGFALKTCKGHSFALTAAAWAHQHQMPISLQDLTNPGLSAVHAALFAAYVPTINGVELNSPQFTPAANADWIEHYPGLFRVEQGMHRLPDANAPGLGGGSAK